MKSNSLSQPESLETCLGMSSVNHGYVSETQLENINETSRTWSHKWPGANNGTIGNMQPNSRHSASYDESAQSMRIPPMFCELAVLTNAKTNLEWRQSARWIKFEEDVEEGGERWSKPYVGTLSLHSIYQLKSLIMNGVAKLPMDALTWESVLNTICLNSINNGTLSIEERENLRIALLLPKRHQYELSTTRSQGNGKQANKRLQRKLPQGTEASNILVGEVNFLEKPLSVFIRLMEAHRLGNLTEVPIPSRFIYILLGPNMKGFSYREIGRAMATLLSDESFRGHAYKARNIDHLLHGMKEFLKSAIVIPPREWDPSIRIEPPQTLPSQENHGSESQKSAQMEEDVSQIDDYRAKSGLTRTGRIFGGLMNDIKRKSPWYWSDFKDAMNLQCIATWIFLYFACLSPIITFGGLLSQATGKNIAAIESLVSSFICGIAYGLFAGQPLALLGSTGPVLVFESIVYEYCQHQGWDYLTFRLWIGTWIAVILMLLTAFDASASVCYITRFTEENFATLIAVIFIFKAVESVASLKDIYPLHLLDSNNHLQKLNSSVQYNRTECLTNNGTSVVTANSDVLPNTDNIFLMSVILFLGTFLIAVVLKNLRNALFFSTFVRQFISDFAVIFAIVIMSYLDYSMQVATPKLEVPSELKPTLPTRGWLIPPTHEKNPSWSALFAILPALLGTILIFMDQQITAVIINRKENKLKKGCGYHLDLFVLSILIQICSVMGLPWFVAATVLSLNHVNSLKQESECSAPGERPQYLGVREQRVTQILIFVTIGFSVVLTPILSHIPMPVLFGVFLYMGVASLQGLQFFQRILIAFMPEKYQPDYGYLRHVPIRRVHLFTVIQLACLFALWIIKSFSQTSILFPVMLVFMVGIRKGLDRIFTQRELKILDDLMPGSSLDETISHDMVESSNNRKNNSSIP